MKTPMQELIEKLNNVKPTEFCSIETIKGWAESMLEKEKEQIENAYDKGQESEWHKSMGLMGDHYYNETFNTK
jgi:hypothetical protein